MGQPFTYDPKRVIITFGGIPISGFAEGTFVDAKPSGDRFTRKIGADGEVTRVRSADRTHEVTITLQQSSASNDYFSKVLLADVIGNAGVLPLTITDLNGTTVQAWAYAWIKTPPPITDGKDLSDRAWVIDTAQVIVENYGGNLNG